MVANIVQFWTSAAIDCIYRNPTTVGPKIAVTLRWRPWKPRDGWSLGWFGQLAPAIGWASVSPVAQSRRLQHFCIARRLRPRVRASTLSATPANEFARRRTNWV